MRILRTLALGLVACAALTPWANAESPLHGYTTVLPVTRSVPLPANANRAAKPLPQWRYTITAASDLGGKTYTGTIVGTDPHAAVKGSTTLPVQIVPLVITINDGSSTVTYDPTKPDSCSTSSAINTVKNSPIFTTTTNWGMDGNDIGKTQYIDAFQRAEFWSLVHGTNYHVLLSPTVLASQKLAFTGASKGLNFDATQNGGCGHIGVVNMQDMDSRVQKLITGVLAASVNTGTFPIFITKDVVMSDPGVSLTNCCVLGYHSGLIVGGHLQVYSPFSLDVSGLFGGDVNTLSHEMGEAINDPNGSNPTPVWGNIGQTKGQCQNNFEVGDPLSNGFGTPTNPFKIVSNGVTYHMQELAFLSWYYGGPSLGAGGKYSDHGTFTGYARLCSAGGGTN